MLLKSVLGDVFGTEEKDDVFEGGGPVLLRGAGIVAECLDVEGDGEALLWAGEVEERGADDAVEHGVRVIERGGAANEAVEKLLVMMHRDKAGAVAEEDVDVAGESGGEWFVGGIDVEVEMELVELFGFERPGVALGGEDRRARGVEGAESVHESGEVFGFGEVVEVVGVFAEVDEVNRRVGRVRPGDDEDGVVGSALCGPFG
jgi:hypothetical protein